jgi:uncharacterized coiled-coil protein SlyX
VKTVPLGFELNTGAPVTIPINHLAVTGQTQMSGKTTTLEALVARSGLRAIAFVTKRGEGSFRTGRRIAPYFRERADWQFVASVLEATMREKLKMERAWIMRASKGAKTLEDVQANVVEALPKAKGMSADMYLMLHEYLAIVIPQLGPLRRQARELSLEPGLNVMDLTTFSMEVQALIVRSVLEQIAATERETITIIPEAWEFIPQSRGSPVLLAAEQLIRKGAALGNVMWLDSQDIAGVHKNVLRQVAVWILGVQREINEVKRTLAHISTSSPRPTAAEIMALGRGQFIACWGRHVTRVYVQPAWMDDAVAVAIARRPDDALYAPGVGTAEPEDDQPPTMAEEDEMDRQEREQYEARISALEQAQRGQKAILADLHAQVVEAQRLRDSARETVATIRRSAKAFFDTLALGPLTPAAGNGQAADVETLIGEVLRRLPVGTGGVTYQVAPVEKLRKDYQQREVDRLLEAVSAFDVVQKDILALAEMTDTYLSQPTIAARLGKGMGGWLAQRIKPMADAGFVESKERQGVRRRLRQKITEDLAHYGATDEEIEAVYQQVMARIAGATAAAV